MLQLTSFIGTGRGPRMGLRGGLIPSRRGTHRPSLLSLSPQKGLADPKTGTDRGRCRDSRACDQVQAGGGQRWWVWRWAPPPEDCEGMGPQGGEAVGHSGGRGGQDATGVEGGDGARPRPPPQAGGT